MTTKIGGILPFEEIISILNKKCYLCTKQYKNNYDFNRHLDSSGHLNIIKAVSTAIIKTKSIFDINDELTISIFFNAIFSDFIPKCLYISSFFILKIFQSDIS